MRLVGQWPIWRRDAVFADKLGADCIDLEAVNIFAALRVQLIALRDHFGTQVAVERIGETFIVRVVDYGQSLRSAANRAALYAQSDLRRLFHLDHD
jgi:hypothetical protein